jgi:hypothetical protein
MSGGIVQLVATGAQDAWLTGKPEVSFFRSSYKRYTHYANSTERQLIQGNPSAGNISTIRLEKKGDLFNYVYFIAKDSTGALIPGIDWSKVVDKVELLIGGQIVDTQDMTWMTQVEPVMGAQNYSQRYLNNDTDGLTNVINGFFPLKFFFCKDWNVSLPLVALQYHDVELRITWSSNLNYRVGYELYTVPPSSSTATLPVPTAASLGIASTAAAANPVTGATVLAAMTVTISNASLTASQRYQTTAFTYSNATFQLVPGMTFATTLASTPDLIVVSVTPTSTTAGTFTGYLSVTSTSTSLASASFTVKAYSSATVTLTSLSMGSATPTAPTTGTNVYTGVTIGWTATTTAPAVGAVLSGFTNTFGTNTVPYISAINYTGDGAATVTLTVIGTVATGSAITLGSAITTPFYQQVNMLVTSSAGISPGQTMLGSVTAQIQNQPNPTVNTVYSSSTIVSVNTNQYQSLTGAAAAPRTAAQLDTQYTGATFWFIPTQYYAGVVTSSSTVATTGSSGAAMVTQYTTVNGANTTTNIVPALGGSLFVFNAGQTLTNACIQTAASNIAMTITCTAAGGTTVPVANSQFFVIPQVSARGQLVSAQPYVDKEGSSILQLTNLTGTSALAVGQQVLSTNYDGPVTVSQIVTTGGSLIAGTGTATIEISFPVQTKPANVSTGLGTQIQFIDPTQAATAPGVTVSTTGFNGTYAQLQYEAWTNFVYLDQAEREYFANTPMDILFTQVNRIPIGTGNMQELALAHPIKYLAFLANNYTTSYQNAPTTGIPAANYQFKTQINGVDIGDSRSMFQWMDVPHYYHTPFGYKHSGATAPVALITYCLDTSKLQPTGTLNFSRIDTYRIVAPPGVSLSTLSGATGNYFYAVNYNVLRIKDGMAGQLYSN